MNKITLLPKCNINTIHFRLSVLQLMLLGRRRSGICLCFTQNHDYRTLLAPYMQFELTCMYSDMFFQVGLLSEASHAVSTLERSFTCVCTHVL